MMTSAMQPICLATVAALACVCHAQVNLPIPPKQTAGQKAWLAALSVAAGPASAAATPALLSALSDPRARALLPPARRKDTAAQLLARLREEVRLAEMHHGFQAEKQTPGLALIDCKVRTTLLLQLLLLLVLLTLAPAQNCADFDLAMLRQSPALYNLWELTTPAVNLRNATVTRSW